MAQNFTALAPDPNTPMDSHFYNDWFLKLQQFLQGVAKLGEQDTFTNQVNVWGNYVGSGQLYVQQKVNDPNANSWAIVGQTINQASVAGTIAGGFFQSQAIAGGSGFAFGAVTEVWNGSPTQAGTAIVTLVGFESGVVQGYSNNTARTVGINAVFKDRPDNATAPFGGLGSNKYNNNSIAFLISSQVRSSAGEYCGWSSGIFFDVNSIDIPSTGTMEAVGFDASRVPSTRMICGVWLADDTQYRYSTDGYKKCYYNAAGGILKFQDNAADRFGISMSDGTVFFWPTTATTVGAAGAAAALPANPLGYMICRVNNTIVKIPYYNS